MYARMTAAVLLTSIATFAVAQSTPPDKELSYSLGALLGKRVSTDFETLDYDELMRGFAAGHGGEMDEAKLGSANQVVQQYLQQARASQQEMAVQKGADYLTENAKRDGVTVTESGLQYEVVTEGNGGRPAVTDNVTVHYRGTLLDGSEFDSSYRRGTPATFPLNGVIPGWTEGVQLMQVGSKFRFVIPPDLAYGERGAGANIGPNETLIFEVELISIGEG